MRGHDIAGNAWPAHIVKVRLSDFQIAGVLQLRSGESVLAQGLSDCGGFAYFLGWDRTNLGKGWGNEDSFLVKVKLSDFSRVQALRLPGSPFPGASLVTSKDQSIAYVPIRGLKLEGEALKKAVAAGSRGRWGLGTPGMILKVRL